MSVVPPAVMAYPADRPVRRAGRFTASTPRRVGRDRAPWPRRDGVRPPGTRPRIAPEGAIVSQYGSHPAPAPGYPAPPGYSTGPVAPQGRPGTLNAAVWVSLVVGVFGILAGVLD